MKRYLFFAFLLFGFVGNANAQTVEEAGWNFKVCVKPYIFEGCIEYEPEPTVPEPEPTVPEPEPTVPEPEPTFPEPPTLIVT